VSVDTNPNWSPASLYADVGEMDLSGASRRFFEVTLNRLRYACCFTPLPGADCLHVAIRSTVAQPERRPPAFAREHWTEAMRGHVLSVCDPTLFLHLGMRVSCFLGTREQDPVEGLIRLAEGAARSLGIDRSRIVYWGGSSGGFGAAMAAIRSEEGRAVLINPLLEVPYFRRTPVAPPIIETFGGGSDEQVFAAFRLRMSVSATLTEARLGGLEPKLLLVQNLVDAQFHRHQFVPFCRAFGLPPEGGFDPTGALKSMVYEHESGHALEPPEVLGQIVAGNFPIEFQSRSAPSPVSGFPEPCEPMPEAVF
jgi:hypothetical protein